MIGLLGFVVLGKALLTGVQGGQTPLQAYVSRADSSYSFSKSGPLVGFSGDEYSMVSQTWKGFAWKHPVDVVWPSGSSRSGRNQAAILVITGGKPNKLDLFDASILAEASGLPVATLFEIPNQPLYGMKEDDLIAHTFEEYFKSGDKDWPLLFPMTKSAVGAMNGLEKELGFKRFVVTGASKRGWTTWLTAATGDKRVIGIAPIVFDNLNFLKQIPRQKELWGYYSEQIADYTRRGLQDVLASPLGRELLKLVDPYSYVSGIKIPILTVNGACDPYWVPDAWKNYFEALPASARTFVAPNQHHNFDDKAPALHVIGSFARLTALGKTLPSCSARLDGRRVVTSAGSGFVGSEVWVAESENHDYHLATWRRIDGFELPLTEKKMAVVVVFRFRVDGSEFSLTSHTMLAN